MQYFVYSLKLSTYGERGVARDEWEREGEREGGRERGREREREGGREEGREAINKEERELRTYSTTKSLSKFMRVCFTVLQSLEK